jgi:flagellar biosynthesis protein FlhF
MAGRYDELETPEHEAAGKDSANDGGSAVWRELTRLRALLQNQLAGFAWSAEKRRHPVRVHVMQKILAAGFSPKLARHLASGLPKNYSAEQADTWLRQVLIRNLRVFAPADMPGLKPGVWALVGPTGHGKTTTLAKLAAKAALQHGSDRVALISVDGYRIGAQQQLETYARMMGVAFIGLDDASELPQALSDMKNGKACVLIDSAGFAPADERFASQLAALKQADAGCLLTLSASTQGNLAESIIRRHAAHTLDGVIVTKLDEGGLCGAVLDCLMRYRLALACLSTGQKVPEDLHAAHASYMVDRALRACETSGFAMQDEDWAVYAGMQAGTESGQETLRRSG